MLNFLLNFVLTKHLDSHQRVQHADACYWHCCFQHYSNTILQGTVITQRLIPCCKFTKLHFFHILSILVKFDEVTARIQKSSFIWTRCIVYWTIFKYRIYARTDGRTWRWRGAMKAEWRQVATLNLVDDGATWRQTDEQDDDDQRPAPAAAHDDVDAADHYSPYSDYNDRDYSLCGLSETNWCSSSRARLTAAAAAAAAAAAEPAIVVLHVQLAISDRLSSGRCLIKSKKTHLLMRRLKVYTLITQTTDW